QAEDGIRAFHVTGVQTCALPICNGSPPSCRWRPPGSAPDHISHEEHLQAQRQPPAGLMPRVPVEMQFRYDVGKEDLPVQVAPVQGLQVIIVDTRIRGAVAYHHSSVADGAARPEN